MTAICTDVPARLPDLPLEEWKPVVGYEGRYDVSNLGRVWSYKSQKVLRPGPTSRGYLSVVLYDGSSPKRPQSHCVHSLVMAAFAGPKPDGYEVDHGKKGKQCNEISNLEYVTSSENKRAAVRDGLIRIDRGTDNANAKLTASQVRSIRQDAGIASTNELAKKFGVCRDVIRHVIRRKSYVAVE